MGGVAARRAAAVAPERCRPRDRAEGYAIQSELVRLSGQRVAGWKIAATSLAGQRHLNVDGPLAGPLLADRLVGAGSTVDVRHNRMRLAEAEFVFRMAASLPPRGSPYTIGEVKSATASVHPAIEVTYGGGLFAGDLVITGTCVEPIPIAPGERLRVDLLMDIDAIGR